MTLPNLESDLLPTPTFAEVQAKELTHPPRMLLLYGSNRERSYSRLAVTEAGRILERFGCEVKIFHPKGLPLPEDGDLELGLTAIPAARQFYTGRNSYTVSRYSSTVSSSESSAM